MKFKKRILLGYITVLLSITLIGGTAVISLLMRQYRRDEQSMMETLAQQTISQLDSQITLMQAAMDNILSNKEVLNSIYYLASDTTDSEYHRECVNNLKMHLSQWFYMKHFYRVLFYNETGERISSIANRTDKKLDIRTDLQLNELVWLESVRGRIGIPKLIAPHLDEWGTTDPARVVSLVKEIQGSNMGFLEIQITEDALNEQLSGVLENYNVYIYCEEDVFYCSKAEDSDTWMSFCEKNEGKTMETVHPTTGIKELIAVSKKSENGLQAVLTEDASIIWQKAGYYVFFSIVVIVLLFGVFLLYVTVVSNRLTQPIIKLRRQIESMDYLQEDGHFRLDEHSDEMGSFGEAFRKMVNTINELLLKDMEAEIQIQRSRVEKRELQLMYLRSQINPHFLYNTLETIRMKAVCGENQDVISMIEMLIDFFRNGLELDKQVSTLKEEMEIIRAYTGIMSYRYPMIQILFDIDEKLLDCKIPCFVLQPLLENSFFHGLKKKCYCGVVEICAFSQNENLACISIRNDGEIITEEELAGIRERSKGERKEQTFGKKRHIGLNNIEERLKLIYPNPECGLFFYAEPQGGLRVEVIIEQHKKGFE